MAVARQGQSNAMLYTVITFVALFLIAAVCAVIFYIKTEDWRNECLAAQQNLDQFANSSEVRNIATIVGQKSSDSRLTQMNTYLDRLYTLLLGVVPPDTSAEAKLGQAEAKYADVLKALPKGMAVVTDANGPGTISLIGIYDNELAQQQNSVDDLTKQLNDVQDELGIAKKGAAEREQELRDKIAAEQERADSVQTSYNQLRDLMTQKGTEQVATLMQQRDEAIKEKDISRQELLAAMSKLTIAQNSLKDARSQLEIIKPKPKEDIAAYKPDGSIISIDTSSDIVFINIGNDAKVYPGLTFSVYDRNAPIPTDGTNKAEIEIFNVDKSTSIARIIKQSKRNPITEGDSIVNLIWDGKAVNRFIVAGDFDFNDDGTVDSDGASKVVQLIENWGGRVEENVSIDTDFVVLGVSPSLKKKPTLDEIEMDPMANDKYDASVKASERYQAVKEQSKDLYIPVFSVKRFLNFIGYGSMATGSVKK